MKTLSPKTPPSCSGFTLVEVLVTALILAIGLLSVATMTARSTIQDSRAYYMSRASTMMEEFIEDTTKDQYDKGMFSNMTDTSIDRTIDGVAYHMGCGIQEDTPIDNTKEMTCTISWNNKGIQTSTTYVYVFAQKY
jgi:prepilin-type N-terminal cleavage/methylation domain-containing protein